MANEELNTKLYEKMFAEQDVYRSWPKSEDSRQPQCPEEKAAAIENALKCLYINYNKRDI